MLQVTDIHLERLMFLRDVVMPKVWEMDKKGRVDLDCYMRFAVNGRHCCVLGWAAQDPYFQKQGLRLERQSVFDDWHVTCRVWEFFGISRRDTERLFGPRSRGDLFARAQLLDTLIEQKAAALA
jgi:hypothetical protein